MQKILLTIVLLLMLTRVSYSQEDSSKTIANKNRKIILITGTGLLATTTLIGLNQIWYEPYASGSFHFFNDWTEWEQMDKAGHVCATYQTTRLMMDASDWAGFSGKQKLIIGASVGLAYMTAIEVMDGYSTGWGFSWGDEVANILGTGIAVSQEALWKQQRIQIKYSYAQSGLAQYNPSLLGETNASRLIKDYNAQTYWISTNPFSFINKETKFPKWLNLAFGYSAYGMLGGRYNNVAAQEENGTIFKVERQRRYYLSIDIDLTQIPVKSKALKTIFSIVNVLKFPAPAIEFTSNGLRWYGIYY